MRRIEMTAYNPPIGGIEKNPPNVGKLLILAGLLGLVIIWLLTQGGVTSTPVKVDPPQGGCKNWEPPAGYELRGAYNGGRWVFRLLDGAGNEIGFVDYILESLPRAIGAETGINYGWSGYVYVKPEFRQQGVASYILKESEAAMAKAAPNTKLTSVRIFRGGELAYGEFLSGKKDLVKISMSEGDARWDYLCYRIENY